MIVRHRRTDIALPLGLIDRAVDEMRTLQEPFANFNELVNWLMKSERVMELRPRRFQVSTAIERIFLAGRVTQEHCVKSLDVAGAHRLVTPTMTTV